MRLHQKTAEPSSNVPPALCISRRRRQLNTVLEEIRGLGHVPLPGPLPRQASWFEEYRQDLLLHCGDEVTPIFSSQLRILLQKVEGAILSGGLSEKAVTQVAAILLGPHPYAGQLTALSEFERLRPLFCLMSSRVGKLTHDTMRVFLNEPKPADECRQMLNRSRACTWLKLHDSLLHLEFGWMRMWSWIFQDLSLLVSSNSDPILNQEAISGVLEVFTLGSHSENHKSSHSQDMLVSIMLMMDSVFAGSWVPICPMSGWWALAVMVDGYVSQGADKYHSALRTKSVSVNVTFQDGLSFGRLIKPDPQRGFILPPHFGSLPKPAVFLVENDLLQLLMDSQRSPDDDLFEKLHVQLGSLVKSAKKEYQKATRLVNLTLRLVTELAAEEGIQLPKEEKTRLLQNIAASDRKGVMSRAWESSPIKGSVPSVIQDFTKKKAVLSRKESEESKVLIHGLTHPSRLVIFAYIALVGFTTLGLLRDRAFGDHVDYESMLAAFEPALMAKLRERPRCVLHATNPFIYVLVMTKISDSNARPLRQALSAATVRVVCPLLVNLVGLPPGFSQALSGAKVQVVSAFEVRDEASRNRRKRDKVVPKLPATDPPKTELPTPEVALHVVSHPATKPLPRCTTRDKPLPRLQMSHPTTVGSGLCIGSVACTLGV
ncbi:MAG: hypothetical protein KVP17_004292 [Porospora cf. gigantea B]|uniref:uncharacterized protein n=1 Tax=Porospora cf. gigantea B TaxID=2853592 RepID=UPI0035719723|nr:MAG: hypothetical protein KVP17_004292 [Porospora cf. gigantea B]